MGNSEIWDKYYEYCIGNTINFMSEISIQQEWYLSQIFTAIPMLFPY